METGAEVLWPNPSARLPRWRPDLRRLRPAWRQCPPRLLRWLLDPPWFWMLLGTYEGEPLVLDSWQVAHMRDYSRLRAREKAPQIGFSLTCSLEATWESVLFDDATNTFVSVDQREAQEKVLYSLKAYRGLPDQVQSWAPLVNESREELLFGSYDRPSRILSRPASAGLRGPRTSVYLDEADFYKDGGKETFRIMLGRIARGLRGTMGSTCFGEDTTLDVVMSGSREDQDEDDLDPELLDALERGADFSKARLPWQAAENPDVLETVALARRALSPGEFAEEYGCVRGGGGEDTFPPHLVRGAQHDEPALPLDEMGRPEFAPEGDSVGGYDVGKSRNPSILTLWEKRGRAWRQVSIVRPTDPQTGRPLGLTDQEAWLGSILFRVPGLRLGIDASPIGAQMAESLERRFGRRVVQIVAGSKPAGKPPQDRGSLAAGLKSLLDAGELELLPDREQATQFKRTRITAAGVEQPGSRRKTHYDIFWSCSFAAYVAGAKARGRSVYNEKSVEAPGLPAEDRARMPAIRVVQAGDLLADALADAVEEGVRAPWAELAREMADRLDAILAERADAAVESGDLSRAMLLIEQRQERAYVEGA